MPWIQLPITHLEAGGLDSALSILRNEKLRTDPQNLKSIAQFLQNLSDRAQQVLAQEKEEESCTK